MTGSPTTRRTSRFEKVKSLESSIEIPLAGGTESSKVKEDGFRGSLAEGGRPFLSVFSGFRVLRGCVS